MKNNVNDKLSLLIQKLMNNSITLPEYKELTELMEYASLDKIDFVLNRLWEDYESDGSMTAEEEDKLFSLITEKIVNEKESNSHKSNRISLPSIKRFYLNVASILLPILLISSAFYFLSNKIETTKPFLTRADLGEKSYILLPDSSEVWLNSDSELSYNSDFDKHPVVTLNGEAYFKIKTRKDNQFIVSLKTSNIIVQGTTFNVSAYDDDSIVEVSLVHGRISIQDKLNSEILACLQPNQQFSYPQNRLSSWSVTDCDALVSGVWHNGVLEFSNATTAEVYQKMERWYGVNISVENPNDRLRYGFTMKSESLREILDLINIITPITYNINGKEVIIKYK